VQAVDQPEACQQVAQVHWLAVQLAGLQVECRHHQVRPAFPPSERV